MTLADGASVSRRAVLKQLALAVTSASSGVFNLEAARVVHALAREERQTGGYELKVLTAPEFATVSRLAELIVPADAGGGSGVDAGAVEFIDLLCSQNDVLVDIYQRGLRWFDSTMRRRTGTRFLDASEIEQTQLLDALVEAGRSVGASELTAGVEFFDWVRRMTVDAYYTSPIGMADLQYQGNAVLTRFDVPPEALTFVSRRIEEL